jgi:hypothetical protein
MSENNDSAHDEREHVFYERQFGRLRDDWRGGNLTYVGESDGIKFNPDNVQAHERSYEDNIRSISRLKYLYLMGSGVILASTACLLATGYENLAYGINGLNLVFFVGGYTTALRRLQSNAAEAKYIVSQHQK